MKVTLEPLKSENREKFIIDNQVAFNFGALEEFGKQDCTFEEDDEIISRETIEKSIDDGEAYCIICEEEVVGGVVVKVSNSNGSLELLFVSPNAHSKGIGYSAWCEIEKIYPKVKTWETVTPYFEKRNIHFYINRCGFHIVEYFNSHHPDPNDPAIPTDKTGEKITDGMFRFEKKIK
ncbi:MAG: GNAT family N-acetyltransferase [Culicoidibacterales bacterium]